MTCGIIVSMFPSYFTVYTHDFQISSELLTTHFIIYFADDLMYILTLHLHVFPTQLHYKCNVYFYDFASIPTDKTIGRSMM